MHILTLILQVALLVAWYTVAPGLPWWLAFLPAIAWGIGVVFFFLILAIVALAAAWAR